MTWIDQNSLLKNVPNSLYLDVIFHVLFQINDVRISEFVYDHVSIHLIWMTQLLSPQYHYPDIQRGSDIVHTIIN